VVVWANQWRPAEHLSKNKYFKTELNECQIVHLDIGELISWGHAYGKDREIFFSVGLSSIRSCWTLFHYFGKFILAAAGLNIMSTRLL
jgi:hypothetical protein